MAVKGRRVAPWTAALFLLLLHDAVSVSLRNGKTYEMPALQPAPALADVQVAGAHGPLQQLNLFLGWLHHPLEALHQGFTNIHNTGAWAWNGLTHSAVAGWQAVHGWSTAAYTAVAHAGPAITQLAHHAAGAAEAGQAAAVERLVEAKDVALTYPIVTYAVEGAHLLWEWAIQHPIVASTAAIILLCVCEWSTSKEWSSEDGSSITHLDQNETRTGPSTRQPDLSTRRDSVNVFSNTSFLWPSWPGWHAPLVLHELSGLGRADQYVPAPHAPLHPREPPSSPSDRGTLMGSGDTTDNTTVLMECWASWHPPRVLCGDTPPAHMGDEVTDLRELMRPQQSSRAPSASQSAGAVNATTPLAAPQSTFTSDSVENVCAVAADMTREVLEEGPSTVEETQPQRTSTVFGTHASTLRTPGTAEAEGRTCSTHTIMESVDTVTGDMCHSGEDGTSVVERLRPQRRSSTVSVSSAVEGKMVVFKIEAAAGVYRCTAGGTCRWRELGARVSGTLEGPHLVSMSKALVPITYATFDTTSPIIFVDTPRGGAAADGPRSADNVIPPRTTPQSIPTPDTIDVSSVSTAKMLEVLEGAPSRLEPMQPQHGSVPEAPESVTRLPAPTTEAERHVCTTHTVLDFIHGVVGDVCYEQEDGMGVVETPRPQGGSSTLYVSSAEDAKKAVFTVDAAAGHFRCTAGGRCRSWGARARVSQSLRTPRVSNAVVPFTYSTFGMCYVLEEGMAVFESLQLQRGFFTVSGSDEGSAVDEEEALAPPPSATMHPTQPATIIDASVKDSTVTQPRGDAAVTEAHGDAEEVAMTMDMAGTDTEPDAAVARREPSDVDREVVGDAVRPVKPSPTAGFLQTPSNGLRGAHRSTSAWRVIGFESAKLYKIEEAMRRSVGGDGGQSKGFNVTAAAPYLVMALMQLVLVLTSFATTRKAAASEERGGRSTVDTGMQDGADGADNGKGADEPQGGGDGEGKDESRGDERRGDEETAAVDAGGSSNEGNADGKSKPLSGMDEASVSSSQETQSPPTRQLALPSPMLPPPATSDMPQSPPQQQHADAKEGSRVRDRAENDEQSAAEMTAANTAEEATGSGADNDEDRQLVDGAEDKSGLTHQSQASAEEPLPMLQLASSSAAASPPHTPPPAQQLLQQGISDDDSSDGQAGQSSKGGAVSVGAAVATEAAGAEGGPAGDGGTRFMLMDGAGEKVGLPAQQQQEQEQHQKQQQQQQPQQQQQQQQQQDGPTTVEPPSESPALSTPPAAASSHTPLSSPSRQQISSPSPPPLDMQSTISTAIADPQQQPQATDTVVAADADAAVPVKGSSVIQKAPSSIVECENTQRQQQEQGQQLWWQNPSPAPDIPQAEFKARSQGLLSFMLTGERGDRTGTTGVDADGPSEELTAAADSRAQNAEVTHGPKEVDEAATNSMDKDTLITTFAQLLPSASTSGAALAGCYLVILRYMGLTINNVRALGRSEEYLRVEKDEGREAASHAYAPHAEEMLVGCQMFVSDKLKDLKGAEAVLTAQGAPYLNKVEERKTRVAEFVTRLQLAAANKSLGYKRMEGEFKRKHVHRGRMRRQLA